MSQCFTQYDKNSFIVIINNSTVQWSRDKVRNKIKKIYDELKNKKSLAQNQQRFYKFLFNEAQYYFISKASEGPFSIDDNTKNEILNFKKGSKPQFKYQKFNFISSQSKNSISQLINQMHQEINKLDKQNIQQENAKHNFREKRIKQNYQETSCIQLLQSLDLQVFEQCGIKINIDGISYSIGYYLSKYAMIPIFQAQLTALGGGIAFLICQGLALFSGPIGWGLLGLSMFTGGIVGSYKLTGKITQNLDHQVQQQQKQKQAKKAIETIQKQIQRAIKQNREVVEVIKETIDFCKKMINA